MFIYFQDKNKGPWQYVAENEQSLKLLRDQKIPLQSVLSIKEPIEEEEEKHGKSYKGPFYVDIDISPEGESEEAFNKARIISIDSAIKFADLLESNNVSAYQVYLSGQKGFHFIIPMTTFCAARPVRSLPLIYKEMALDLYVDGTDMSVYNEGRPRLLRTVNVQRADNKKYKVQVSKEELYAMTPEKYAELVSAPRPELPYQEGKLSIKMQALYESAKIRMEKKRKALENMEFVPREEMQKTLGENEKLPGCIQLLIEKGDTKPDSNFNQAVIQFASYVVSAGVKGWYKYAKEFAKNVKSSSYNTDTKRLLEIKKIVNYVASNKSYGFSKAMLFSVMEPCRDCVICNGTIEDGTVVPEDYEETNDIIETPHGYFTGWGKSKRQITTFTLEVISKFSRQPDEEDQHETRVGTNAIIKVNGHKREKVTILEDAWNSVRGFKEVIKGKKNYAFYGTDIDLQKIQHKLFADESTMTEISYVHSVGIHRHKVGNRTIFVYVEPGFSVASTKEKNTHQIWGSVPAFPSIQTASYPEADDSLKQFIDKLVLCNDPEVTCTLIGWMALCHIKVQLTMRDNQFPILNLWGNAGCVDKDTEFLTPTGWKRISEYQKGDKVAQWHPDGSTEFVEPENYISAPCVNGMLHFKSESFSGFTGIDMVVSENHRMPFLNNNKVSVATAGELLRAGREVQLPFYVTPPKGATEQVVNEMARARLLFCRPLSIVSHGTSCSQFIPGDGKQYCFTTPSSFWLARRNGKIFPTGNSGKSAISSLFAYLHGIDYMLEHSPMSLQGTTPWAVAQYCTTSESTPRLIEEFNRGEIPMSKYDQFSGMFKAAWNRQTFAKGGIDSAHVGGRAVSGAKVVEAKISAPLCVMSEQAPERPALRQRMIQVNVKKAGREPPEAVSNFYYVVDNKHMLAGLARAMVWQSLGTHPETVVEAMDSFKDVVPNEIDARPKFSYQALLTGIKFFCDTLLSIGLDKEYVDEKLEFMTHAIMDKLNGTLEQVKIEKSRTEVSLVLAQMALMADSFDANLSYTLEPRRHYIRDPDHLYLDIAVCHTMYTRWARSSNDKVIINSMSQFETLIQQEDFFISITTHPDISDGSRRLAKLDCLILKERGIDVTMFEETH